MIYDSEVELHVMIQHADQGFVSQRLLQKYCSQTRNRQERRSITAELCLALSRRSTFKPVAAAPPPSLHILEKHCIVFLPDYRTALFHTHLLHLGEDFGSRRDLSNLHPYVSNEREAVFWQAWTYFQVSLLCESSSHIGPAIEINN